MIYTLTAYQNDALRTVNSKLSQDELLMNAALGLAGEAGEVADIIKKHVFHGKPLDVGHLIEETGDGLWYSALVATALGVPLSIIAERNIEKLKRRYPSGGPVNG